MQPQCYHYQHVDDVDNDLREATCTNKNSQPLLEVLKSELECGWDAGTQGTANVLLVLMLCGVAVFVGVWSG